jgi:glycosyltransferase involved in cell wall biosynthesis
VRRRGVKMLSVLHDPVRDYVVGPAWWHALSIRQAYSFLDTALVHTRDSVPVPADVQVTWVPYGIHPYPPAERSRDVVRAELGIPAEARLITSFGYIRDNKNLDLVLRAMADMPDLYLLVAGSEQAGGNRPMSFYRDLATELGCDDRCRWLNRFVSTAEAADLMNASDLSLLVYARSFVSSSAALGVTANYRLPSLVSNGSNTIEAMVKQYRLGIWVEPDSVEAIRQGLREWLAGDLVPDWEGYSRDHSWVRNAAIVHETIQAAGPDRRNGRQGDSRS